MALQRNSLSNGCIGMALLAITCVLLLVTMQLVVFGDDIKRYNPQKKQAAPRTRIIHDTLRLTDLQAAGATDVSMFLRNGRKHPDYDVIIDVGAHEALDYTIPGYKLNYTVFSFELMHANQQRAIQRFTENGLVENKDYTIIKVEPGVRPKVDTTKRPHIYFFLAGASTANRGVATSASDVWAYVAADKPGNTTNTWQYVPGKDEKSSAVTVRLDDVIAPTERIYIFKSDTQGHEYGVFAGARNIVSRGNVKFLQFEYWPAGARNNGFEAIDVLNMVYDAGFECFDVGFSPHIPATRPNEIEKYTAFIDAIRSDVVGAWDDIVCHRFDA